MISIDAENGVLSCIDDGDFESRATPAFECDRQVGMGRELFAAFRERAGGAEQGASLFGVR